MSRSYRVHVTIRTNKYYNKNKNQTGKECQENAPYHLWRIKLRINISKHYSQKYLLELATSYLKM